MMGRDGQEEGERRRGRKKEKERIMFAEKEQGKE